ncbi:protocadherin-11 X-linked [Elysia marginata]|uniref:Protocadherin-11 X-linked n=1 Tax=Elysia marginata TaxID=1093978 RepID=A0AAV4F2U8_9GAST|nr:protocadherin-11 X-linked [Elysia marginata]
MAEYSGCSVGSYQRAKADARPHRARFTKSCHNGRLVFPLSVLLYICLCLIPLVLGDIEVTMDEQKPVGTEVTNLADQRSIFSNVDPSQIPLMTYAILGQNSAPANFFTVQRDKGVITIAQVMDREKICETRKTCKVTFNVAISTNSRATTPFSTVVSVTVVLTDINDMPPRFPAREVVLDISEGFRVGRELKISGAVDGDSNPEFTVRHYNTTPTLDTFSIHPASNPDGSTTINLRLEKELDREKQDSYDFNIIAYDGGSPPMSDYLRVTVRVTDDNDNSPVFEMRHYDFTINEDAQMGDLVGQVTATDMDIGNFGKISYRFSQASEASIRGVFAINSTTGHITLRGKLSTILKAGAPPFSMYVEASDGGDPPRSTQALVSVSVLDSGNNAPFVKVNTVAAGDASTLTVPESAGTDFFVAFVFVEDNDEGAAGETSCELLSDPDFYLNPVEGKGYTLLLNTQVDRETRDSYQVRVSCSDKAFPPLSTEVVLTVNVTDVNDNAPVFVRQLYQATVDENRNPGQYITQVAARDADIGQNAEIVYSLEEVARDYLSIQHQSGVITTKLRLDREANETLRFKVIASDRGMEPRTGETTLVIKLRDVNDNSPIFTRSKFSFLVSELTPNGTFIGKIEASDRDGGANGQVDFYFGGSSGGDTPVPIKVLKNGSLVVSGSLDREERDHYSFTVLARDRGGVPKSTAAPVEVKILDENDNDPVIMFPETKNHSIVLSNFPEEGMVLARIMAYDEDEGGTQPIIYSIFGGDEDGAFSIDSKMGEISVRDITRLKNPHDYYLSIKVEDATIQKRNATTQLKIEVSFENKTEWYDGKSGRGQGRAGANGNGEEDKDGRREHYVVIVGVIGGVTLVLSIIIIAAIVFILRSEKKRHSETNSTMGSNDSFFKNKFFKSSTSGGGGGNTSSGSITTNQTVIPPIQKPAGDGGGGKFQGSASSFTGSGDSGFVMGPGVGGSGLVEQLGKGKSQLQQQQKQPQEDVLLQKKVSFSPDVKQHEGDDDDGDDTESEETNNLQGHGRATPDKQLLRLNLPPTAEANLAWPQFNNPDDLHSDTSGESGTCDSGRGTSDEDIKFDHPPSNIGFLRLGQPNETYMSMSARPNFQYHDQKVNKPLNIINSNINNLNTISSNKTNLAPLPPSSTTDLSAPSIQIPPHLHYPHQQQHQQQHLHHPLIKPGQPRFLEMGSGRHGTNSNNYGTGPARRSYHGPRQMQLSSSSSSSSPSSSPSGGLSKSLLPPPSSSRQQQQQQHPQQQRLLFKDSNSSSNINQDLLRRPGSSLSFTQQGSVMSMDDDASTTTSGSYVINPEDIRLEGMMGKDIIV